MIESLLAKLKSGERVLGTHITCNDSQQTEIIGQAGFEFLWVDTEHTAIERHQLLLHLIAARSAGVPAFVRIPWNDPVLAKPVLEMGVQGVIFPLVETADDALRAVKSCLYPPDGIRGFGPRRAIRYGLDSPMEYIADKSKRILKIIQIETRTAMENIEAIAAIPEIEIFALGPNDLSGSFGKLGRITDPGMLDAYKLVIDKVHAAGKSIIASTGNFSRESIRMWFDLGADLIAVGSEMGFIVHAVKGVMADAKDIFSGSD